MTTTQQAVEPDALTTPLDEQDNPIAKRFRPRHFGRIGLAVVILAVISGLATYSVLTGLTPITPTRDVIVSLMAVNVVLVATMAVLIGLQVKGLLAARKQRIAGAVLHTRLVAVLSLFAAIPAIIVAIFATVTLNRGLDAWFSVRTQSIVDSAIVVATAYLEEQDDVARVDIVAIANDINRQKELFDTNRQRFTQRLAALAGIRSLSAAFVIDQKNRRVAASATANNRITFRSPDTISFEQAEKGELVIIGPGSGNVIRALIKLPNFPGHYLYVYRLINPVVIRQLAKARAEKAEFDKLKSQRAGVQVTFALMYAGVTFIFLLAAIWLGLWFADRLVDPIVKLVGAARQVSRGDLDAKVEVRRDAGDMATLGRTFNQMTAQLKSQHSELISTNHKLDERRMFTEAVLSGVSAGVIGLDGDGKINLVNRSALDLLGVKESELINAELTTVLPQFEQVFLRAQAKASKAAEAQIAMQVEGHDRNFTVRVTTERSSETNHGYVVTFDDITDLVSAQRTSAWADIARRIAHEIKNPLTPIQLSAERLRRKYRKEIVSDPKVFEQCTDTIIRQVGDIGQMVDEFSSFARMPAAVLERQDIGKTVREALVLQRVSSEQIAFEVKLPEDPVVLPYDRRQIAQALTNLAKNAQEAVEARLQETPEPPGRIVVTLTVSKRNAIISISDNGIGLPRENRSRLVEPYVTTREKGTGLGLAIVTRIMDEHGGKLQLLDAPKSFDDGMGAQTRLIFPLAASPAESSTADETSQNAETGERMRT